MNVVSIVQRSLDFTAATKVLSRSLSVLMIVSASILTYQSFTEAPTSDEVGHLVSGLAIVQTGDAAFYRVNPPLHKLISGLAIDCIFDATVKHPYPASHIGSGYRLEFKMAKGFIAAHPKDYKPFFIAGRLVRIPLVLLAAWLLYGMCGKESRRAGWIAAVLFVTSPMTLGHGWLIMPDSIAAIATVGLLGATIEWLRVRDTFSFAVVGVMWGLALGTKFTFCPLFVVWPIGLVLVEATAGRWNWRELWRLPLAHLGQGVIAWVIVVGLYNGYQLFVSLDDHAFRSQTMSRLANTFGSLPSPLPKQYLVGIDEQTLDLERGIPTYVLGTWYPHGNHWYYAVGTLIKEQLAFLFLGIAAIFSIGISIWQPARARVRKRDSPGDPSPRRVAGENIPAHTPPSDWEDKLSSAGRLRNRRRCFGLALFTFMVIFALLSVNRAMALNVRYLLPALPAIYLVIGISVDQLWRTFPKMRRPMVWIVAVLVFGEMGITFPHYFAYANPLFGGSYRVPPALHDSNFDGGQDLWQIEKWLKTHPPAAGVQRYACLHSSLPIEAIDVDIRPPSTDILKQLIASRTVEAATHKPSPDSTNVEIVVMRGLGVPAPWTRLLGGTSSDQRDELKTLLAFPPDAWLTPTTAIYRGHQKSRVPMDE